MYEQTISDVSKSVELVGIAVLIAGGLYSLLTFAARFANRRTADAYEVLRRTLGRSILIGLEILVGADIIRTIAVSPSFTSVGVLGLVVVVRTFLSFSLEAELDGQWPWQRRKHEASLRSNGDTALGQQLLGRVRGGRRPDSRRLDRGAMKVLAVGRPRAGIDARAAIAARAREELAVLWRLYASGTVREMYSPGGPGAVLVLEAESIAAAQAALAELPLVAHEVIDFELIELLPFAAFASLFAVRDTL